MDKVTDLTLDGIIDDPTGVNSTTVLMIATELRELRQPGTPPDLQEWGHAYADTKENMSENMNTAIRCRDQLAALGCTWFRITRHEDRIYVDGWRNQPEKEAAFKVIERKAS